VERRSAGDPGVGDELRLVEGAGVEADRADEQLAASLRELAEQPLERRTTVACLALRLVGDRVLGSQIATCFPFSSAAVETRNATVTRSASSIPVARFTTTFPWSA
jgi:hypothetical protein